jgi:SAM-dependent methyltransferase
VSQSRLLESTFRHFRKERMRRFEHTFEITPRTRVLDVGGSPSIWRFATVQPRLTIVNLQAALEPAPDSIARVAGDGGQLPFKDRAFDIVFSNSVIEHLAAASQRERFAREVARVGRYYWVQTPNRRFPVELHLMLPLVHHLPKRWQRHIVHRFTIWQLLARPSQAQRDYYIEHFLDELHLLDAGEMQELFHDGRIVHERLLGLTKSLIAVRA